MENKKQWECDICGITFDNFQAQGFNGKIYCPLCYFKKLYSDYKSAWEELKKVICKENENDNVWWYQVQFEEIEQKYNLGSDK